MDTRTVALEFGMFTGSNWNVANANSFYIIDEEIQTQIFSRSQGASVLRAVTQSAEMEAIVQAEMEEGETVISGKLLGKVIEEGYTAPQFKKYEQALALSDSEIGEILENDKTIDSNMKILQRTINSYLQQ